MSATAYTSAHPPEWAGPTPTLESGFRRSMATLKHWYGLRKAEAELMGLDDRMLRDIGIDRSEIRSVLRDAAGERVVD